MSVACRHSPFWTIAARSVLCSDHLPGRETASGRTMSHSIFEVVQLLVSQLSLFLALLLGASAIHKVTRFARARRAARDLAGLNNDKSAATAVALAGSWEVCAATLLCLPRLRTVGALVAAAILAIYLLLIARAISSDRREIDCGCSFGAASRPLGIYEQVRNSGLVVCAVLVAGFASAAATQPSWSDWLPAFVLLAIYYALDEVIGLRSTT